LSALDKATELALQLLGIASLLGQSQPAALEGLPDGLIHLGWAEEIRHLLRGRRRIGFGH
jgi:hypothetical protein